MIWRKVGVPTRRHAAYTITEEEFAIMSAADIAKRHFDQALSEALNAGYDADATARYLLGLVVQKYLEYRSVEDVRSELQFVAENCDPNTDYVFMRP